MLTLRPPFTCDDEAGGRRTRWALYLGLTACFSFGCPGVEPSASGSGGAGAGGAPSGTSTSGQGAGGESVSTTSGTGGNNEGGCAADVSSDPANCGECGRACVKDERVAEPRCVEGVCESFCKSGFVNIETPPAPGTDDGCEAEGRRVFVTSQTFPVPQIGGVSGADGRCQNLANAEKLGGSWRAWISGNDSESSPALRFEKEPAAPYMLLDFTPVAADWDDLTNTETPLAHPIDLTETLSTVTADSTAVWTGTSPLGFPTGSSCGAWGNAVQSLGTVGDCTEVTGNWTAGSVNGGLLCTGQARLYCFEQ